MAGRALARAPDFLSQLAAHRGREEAMAGTMVSGARPALALHSVVQVASRHRSSTVRGAGRAAPCKYCKQRPAAFPAAPGAGACGFLYRCPARRALRLTRAGVCALAGSAALLRPAPQVRRPGGRQHPLSCVCVVLRTSRRHESSFASIEGALLVIAPALPAAHSVTPVLAGPPGAPAAGAEIWLLQSHGALPCGGGGDCGGAPCAAGQLQRVAAACDDHRCGRAHVHGSAAGVAFPRPASAALLGGRCSEASCRQAALRRSPGSTDRSASARRPAAVPGLCGRAS
jgi:hypothetical protein